MLRTFEPNVLLSDIGMPGMDDYQLIRAIRTSAPEPLRAMPAIAMTAFVRPEDRDRALDAGFTVHLAKPLDPSQIVMAIDGLRVSGVGWVKR